jgi:predicted dithiol-disulfide oxidoreductase (DUF899 family)
VTQRQVGTREEWLVARRELLEREKELTKLSDELAKQRQMLPWVAVETEYTFDTEAGPKTLAELFDGRSQLLIYHFMLGPNTPDGCPGCTFATDTFDATVRQLGHHDVTFVLASRAPLATLLAYRKRMGWTMPWVSSGATDFNLDFAFFTEDDRRNARFNFGSPGGAGVNVVDDDELMAFSAFVLEDGVVHHTYTCFDRGTDVLNGVWQLLDRAPKGREVGAEPGWPKRPDEYTHASRASGA